MTIDAVTPVTLRADVNGQLVTQVLPAGPLTAPGLLRAEQLLPPAGIAFSQVDWESTSDSSFAQSTVYCITSVTAPAPSFADTTTIDVLVTISASSPIDVNLELIRQSTGPTASVHRIDVANDGSFEVVETSPSTVAFGPFVLAGPVQVLLRMQAAQVGEGAMQLSNVVRVVPANDVLLGTFDPVRCAADRLEVLPSFVGRGISLQSIPALPGDFAIAVLGMALQPVSLPPQAIPCTLLPALHVLVPLPAQQIVDLPLPPSVRPVVFLAQTVVLSSIGSLTTSNTFAVAAF